MKAFSKDLVIKLVHLYGLFCIIVSGCLNWWSVAQKGLREQNFVHQLDTVNNRNSCWRVVGISRVMMLWITVLSELLHLGGGSISISQLWSTSSSIMLDLVAWNFICSGEIEWTISLLRCKKKKKPNPGIVALRLQQKFCGGGEMSAVGEISAGASRVQHELCSPYFPGINLKHLDYRVEFHSPWNFGCAAFENILLSSWMQLWELCSVIEVFL